jgi:predicted small secreted protein
VEDASLKRGRGCSVERHVCECDFSQMYLRVSNGDTINTCKRSRRHHQGEVWPRRRSSHKLHDRGIVVPLASTSNKACNTNERADRSDSGECDISRTYEKEHSDTYHQLPYITEYALPARAPVEANGMNATSHEYMRKSVVVSSAFTLFQACNTSERGKRRKGQVRHIS